MGKPVERNSANTKCLQGSLPAAAGADAEAAANEDEDEFGAKVFQHPFLFADYAFGLVKRKSVRCQTDVFCVKRSILRDENVVQCQRIINFFKDFRSQMTPRPDNESRKLSFPLIKF